MTYLKRDVEKVELVVAEGDVNVQRKVFAVLHEKLLVNVGRFLVVAPQVMDRRQTLRTGKKERTHQTTIERKKKKIAFHLENTLHKEIRRFKYRCGSGEGNNSVQI